MGLTSVSGRFPWRRKWQPTPAFLPGEFHGQRSLMSYSPWSCKESGTTEQLTLHFTSCLQHHYWFCVLVLLINLWSGISVSLKLWLSLFFQYCHFSIYWKPYYTVKVIQSCPTLCDPMDCIVHGILQARILEWVAFPFSRGSSQPRDQTQLSHIAGGFFTSWATRYIQIQQYYVFYKAEIFFNFLHANRQAFLLLKSIFICCYMYYSHTL